MKKLANVKGRAPSKLNTQQMVLELKCKVTLAMNKLADRDTYQIGFHELEKMAECLSPDMIPPFLSCILDIDSEQKSAVRKECIRLMGTLAQFHKGLVGPHLSKMVSTIVKRLKDPDSVVRDACVETVGNLASILISCSGDSEVFVMLVKPIFESLGEQNKQVQSGSAWCLARIIDNTENPPISILQRMLTRTIKLLKNPHFMAKPAVIDLDRSIIQAGGASNQNVQSAAMAGIQEALKSSDWATRKAASIALGEIAASGGSFLGSFKNSCIRSLESCRFDKVKPVRDTALHAIRYWKNLQEPDFPEPSESEFSIKETFYGGDFNDVTSPCKFERKNVANRNVVKKVFTKGREFLNVKNTCQNYEDNSQHSKSDDWHIEIAVPKRHNISPTVFQNEESEGSSVTQSLERVRCDIRSMQDIQFECAPVDDQQECASVSTIAPKNYETKFVTVSHECHEESSSLKLVGKNDQFATDEVSSDEKAYLSKMRDRMSQGSTVTESSFGIPQGCSSQMANEIVCIQKQLMEIDNKQSNLMGFIEVFTKDIMDSLSMIQSRMVGLEHVVDKLAQEVVQGERCPDVLGTKFMKPIQNLSSPRNSTCTPRSSSENWNRKVSQMSAKDSTTCDEYSVSRSRLTSLARQGTKPWTNDKFSSNPSGKYLQKNSGQGIKNTGSYNATLAGMKSSSCTKARQNSLESKSSLCKHVEGFLCQGNLDSAYLKAIYSGDELVLFELLDRTGPVLESLSPKIVIDLLSILASCLLEQRFTNSIIPWLQQVVDLGTIHGATYLVSSSKQRKEILASIQGAANSEFTNPDERRSVNQLAMKLHHIWGNCS